MSHEKDEPRRFRVVGFALVWLFVAGVLALTLFPHLPRSISQWLILLAFGPPLYGLGETFFSWLFSPEHGHAISPRAFSIARVLIALPVVLVVMMLWWLLSLLFVKG
jgi:hypothetical protein